MTLIELPDRYQQQGKGAAMLVLFGLSGLTLLMAGLVLAFLAIQASKRAYLLDAPLMQAADLKPGFCKLRGRLVAVDKPVRSPVSDRPCVYYRLRVQEEKRRWKTTGLRGEPSLRPTGGVFGASLRAWAESDSEGSTKLLYSWIAVLDKADSVPLVIEDDSGRVPLDLGEAEVVAKEKSHVTSDFQRAAPDRLRELLWKRYRLHTVDEAGRLKTMRFAEDVLPDGAQVTVAGTVEEGPDGAPGFQAGSGLLVSELDVSKQVTSARKLAFGYAVAAGGTLLVAVGTLAAMLWTA
jgi:hypothetical protein